MTLQAFDGFQLDFASELSGLKPSTVATLRKHGIVKPERKSVGYSFSFADVLTLRLVRQLIDMGVKAKKIYLAHEYLSNIDPSKCLLHLELAINYDTGDIIKIGENLVSLSSHGQLLLPGVNYIIPIGHNLEQVRKNVIKLDQRLSSRPSRTLTVEAILKKYA
jgi:DNA-binding transcriptional MerR regulator